MVAVIWVLVPSFEGDGDFQSFLAADSLAVQLNIPAKRLQSDESSRALAVPLSQFCDPQHDTIQCDFSSKHVTNTGRDWMIFVSMPSALPHLENLITAIRKDEPIDVRFIALPKEWDSVQSDAIQMDSPAYGSLTLRAAGGKYEFDIRPVTTAKPALYPSPNSMRKLPEGPDHLQGREDWFRGKFEKTD